MSAPSDLVFVREFARLDGCNDKLVRTAIKAGKLPVSADGKVSASLAKSGWRKQNRAAATGADIGADTAPTVRTPVRTRSRTAKAAPAIELPTAEEVAAAVEALLSEDGDDFLTDVLAGRYRSTGGAEQIKENALAAKHLLAVRKEAGNLVEVDRAEAIFFEAARSERDAWISFPTRIGAMLAADLDVDTDKVVEALTVHVQQQLEQLGEAEANFAPEQ
jgi:hypothetical protein